MAYKVFTNGSPLPASDLNTYLMNQSVMVFANSAARSAALPTPTEGMVTYLEDANLLYVWTGSSWIGVATPSPITTQGDLIVGNVSGAEARLAIGAAGTYLSSNGTTASWQAVTITEDWEQLATGTLSGSAVNITSIPARNKYFLAINKAKMNANLASCSAEINPTTMNLARQYNVWTMKSAYATDIFDSKDSPINIPLFKTNNSGTNAGEGNANLFISGGKSGSQKFFHSIGGGNGATTLNGQELWAGMGMSNDTNAVTTIRINTSTGSFSSGTYTLYGTE